TPVQSEGRLSLPPGGFWIDVYERARPPDVPRGRRVLGVAAFNGPDVRRLVEIDGLPLVYYDQQTRGNWFLAALARRAGLGRAVNLPWTSMHTFSCARLREAYIEPVPGHGRRVPVSELHKVTGLGAPSPLICGAINLLGDRRCADSTYTFVFSALYCGSTATNYYPTRAMLRCHWFLHRCFNRYDDLAEVIAISGAAVSPARADDLVMATLMTLVNVRLGQWLVNPGWRPVWFLRWLPCWLVP